jgi:hypothetical protein
MRGIERGRIGTGVSYKAYRYRLSQELYLSQREFQVVKVNLLVNGLFQYAYYCVLTLNILRIDLVLMGKNHLSYCFQKFFIKSV